MNPVKSSAQINPQEVKQCCAQIYETDAARLLLGESFHPGGLRLTERLGHLLQLTQESRALDVASGKGASAIFLVERFGCEITGVDYSRQNVDEANYVAGMKGISARLRFQQADSESLPFPDASFDAVICECAFCTFPDKARAAREFARVLRKGGFVGLTDLTRGPDLPKELDSLLAWVTCIADARPIEGYVDCLHSAGLEIRAKEQHDEALLDMVRQVQGRLLAAEIMSSLKKIELPGFDPAEVKRIVKAALNAIHQGQLGYAVLIAQKPLS